MPRRADLAPVELVEDDEPDPQDAATPSRRRTRWWWLLLAPVVVAALAFAGQQVVDARARAADARIAALPGAIAKVGDSLGVLWQTEPRDAPLAWGVFSRGALHGAVVGPDGSIAYAALDVGTGRHLWSTSLRGPDPALADPLNSTLTSCQPAGDDRAVCLVTDGYEHDSGDAELAGPTTEARVVVLDLADGSILADHPAPPVRSMAVLPDLVATAVVDDHHVVVVANDPMTGDELWRYRDPAPVNDDYARSAVDITAAGDLIALGGRQSGPLVLTAAGTPVEPDEDADTWAINDQGWLTWTAPSTGDPDQVVHVLRPGQPPIEVLGSLLRRSVDDGSLPGLEVSSGRQTYGWDSTTGAQRWQADVASPASWGNGVMILEGRVYLTTADDIVALDGRDGTILWSTPRPTATLPGALLTDGTHLLLIDAPLDASGTADLLVLDRHDGTALRRVPFPTGIASADAVDGVLVAGGEHGVTGVG